MAIVTFISLLVAFGRVTGYKSEVVQAIDHLWVGGLIGIWIYSKSKSGSFDSFYGWVALILSLIELFTFLIGRFH